MTLSEAGLDFTEPIFEKADLHKKWAKHSLTSPLQAG
jgi:hypothetical protein